MRLVFPQVDDAKLYKFQLNTRHKYDSVPHHIGSGVQPEDNLFFDRFFLHFARHKLGTKPEMNLFFFLVFGFYFVGMLLLLTGWQQSLSGKSLVLETFSFKKVTVIVPFRNEEVCIANVIKDIIAQDYRPECVEVILVDDHSADRSIEVISRTVPTLAMETNGSALPTIDMVQSGSRIHFRCVSLPEGKEGKKQAIQLGVALAGSEIIITTDADCRLPVRWLQSIVHSFQDAKVKMVFGGVRMKEEESFFSKLQALEFCSLIGTGAAMSGLGVPVMCNGANLAFLKPAFLEVKGYEGNLDIPSGDDEFLLQKINRRFPGSICFQPDRDSVVETVPMESLRAFVDQRLRWAGKWKRSESGLSQLMALYILVFQASFVALWFATQLNLTSALFAFLLIAGKMIFEFIFLFQVSTFLKARHRALHFLALQFLYPLYVVYVGVGSLVSAPAWKGRIRA